MEARLTGHRCSTLHGNCHCQSPSYSYEKLGAPNLHYIITVTDAIRTCRGRQNKGPTRPIPGQRKGFKGLERQNPDPSAELAQILPDQRQESSGNGVVGDLTPSISAGEDCGAASESSRTEGKASGEGGVQILEGGDSTSEAADGGEEEGPNNGSAVDPPAPVSSGHVA